MHDRAGYKNHIADLCRKFSQDDLTGQVNHKFQYSMSETGLEFRSLAMSFHMSGAWPRAASLIRKNYIFVINHVVSYGGRMSDARKLKTDDG